MKADLDSCNLIAEYVGDTQSLRGVSIVNSIICGIMAPLVGCDG
jgi:hypothetical protein